MSITKSNKRIEIKQLIAMMLLLPLFTSCTTYNSGFGCADAKGVPCTPMEKVDQLISSGEIDAVASKKKRCWGKHCTTEQEGDVLKNALTAKKR